LKDFRGINPEIVAKLADHSIKKTDQMLADGITPIQRAILRKKSVFLKRLFLNWLSCLIWHVCPGMKGIRPRLYYDAGVDTVEKMAGYKPDALLTMMAEHVERTGFDRIAPLPK